MYCPKCGTQNDDNAFKCVKCGEVLQQAGAATTAPATTSTKAVLSLVLGILAITCFWIFTGIPALILGVLANRDIRRDPTRVGGKGLATAGIILGIVGMVFSTFPFLAAIAVPNFLEAQVRSKVSRVKADMRSMATALEAYYVDNELYPAWASGEQGANGHLPKDSVAFKVPTFRVRTSAREKFGTLTTPISYIGSHILRDPWASVGKKEPGATFSYYTDPNGWILVSPGPDRVYDIDPLEEYTSRISQPSDELLAKAYDPTNGTVSGGDIFRVKQ
jgi:type II secretory pathway pseudopilin PulG